MIADKIIQRNEWPEHFQTLEELLAIGKLNNRSVRFLDGFSPSLLGAVEALKKDRPDITIEKIAYLLNIDEAHARALAEKLA